MRKTDYDVALHFLFQVVRLVSGFLNRVKVTCVAIQLLVYESAELYSKSEDADFHTSFRKYF